MRSATLMWRALLGVAAVSLFACGESNRPIEIRQYTDDLAFRISSVPAPPVAEEMTVMKVVVLDKATGQPIQNGQGRIFATSQEHAQSGDGLAKGPEVGTYYAHIRFPVSGDWAIGLQFRRDSTSKLERTQDWQQEILPAPPLGQSTDTTKR
ncbi:MAG TPA: hypothetical protein VIC03_08170 [Gemmatimonadaceae bacterium]|jgi:hypothetical protein